MKYNETTPPKKTKFINSENVENDFTKIKNGIKKKISSTFRTNSNLYAYDSMWPAVALSPNT